MSKKKGASKVTKARKSQNDAAGTGVGDDTTNASRTTNANDVNTASQIVANTMEPLQRPKDLPNDIVAIRSQVLQHVSTKNKETINHAIETFKDSQQIELEKLSRHFENDICPKMKKDLHQQVMQQIKQHNIFEWNDLIKVTIEDSVNALVSASITGKIEAAIAKDREEQKRAIDHNIHCIADSKIGKMISAEKKRTEKSMWGIIRKNLGESVRPMIDVAIALEQQCRTDAINAITTSLKSLDQRLTAFNNHISEVGGGVMKTLADVDEVTKEGVAKIQALTSEDLARIENGLADRIDDTQEALEIQVDTMTTVWMMVKELQGQVKSSKRSPGSRLDDDVLQDEDLICFEDATTLARSSQSTSPQMSGNLLDDDPFGESEVPEGLSKVLDHSNSTAGADLLGSSTLCTEVESGEILGAEQILETTNSPSGSPNGCKPIDGHGAQSTTLVQSSDNPSHDLMSSATTSSTNEPDSCSKI